jgi:hypothetical protein
MTRVSPQEGADKWAQRTAAASQDVVRGVDRVTQAPGQKAAAQSGKWLTKVTQAESKFRENVASVSLGEWQQATKDGASRIASGVNAKKGKMQKFADAFYAHLDRGKSAIDSMPTTTIEESIAKAAAQMRHNAQFRRTAR